MEQQGKDTQNNAKPVGYGSSIQSSGYGNKNRPQQPEDRDQVLSPNHKPETGQGKKMRLMKR